MKRKPTRQQLANLRPWKKGTSGNPKGRPKGSGLSPAAKAARRMTQAMFWQEAQTLPMESIEDLARIAHNPETPAIRAYIANMLVIGHEQGDPSRFNAILDRLFGKQTVPISITDQVEDDPDISDEELTAALAK